MSLLEGAKTTSEVEKNTDRLGGFQLLNSAVHLMEIEVAYLHVSAGGARALAIRAKNDAGSIRATEYFTSGTKKDCKTYYTKDGKNYDLPGFILVSDLMKVVTGGGLENAVMEEKTIKLYSQEAGGEVPTKVQMVTNLVGQKVALGILKQVVDKTAKDAAGDYQPTGETREENIISKVFNDKGLTVVEIAQGVTEPGFILDWKKQYEDKVINLAKGAKDAGSTGAVAQKPATKLFS